MKNRFFKDWFSFSQGERRGVIFLAVLLLLLISAPPLLKSCEAQKMSEDELLRLREQAARLGEAAAPQYDQLADSVVKQKVAAFAFNPNTISRDSLLLLGFSPKQSDAIIRYRERGSGFRSAADFLKLNVITDRQRERLQAYATVPAAPAKKTFAKRDTLARKTFEKPQLAPVELNTADTALLRTLPGIGAYFAQKMVDYREALGGYVSAEQLLEIQNFGHERLQKLAGRITVDVSLVQPLELSEENAERLRRHPYVGAYAARGIAQFAKRKGASATLKELLDNNLVTSLQAQKLKPYAKEQ